MGRYLKLAFTSLVFSAALAHAASRDLSSTVDIAIAAQPLTSALLEFSAQTGMQVVTDGADVRDLKTVGISGRTTVREALAKLLQGSGISFRLMGENTVGLVREGAAAVSATSSNGVRGEPVQLLRVAQSAKTETSAQAQSVAGDAKGDDKESQRRGAGIPEILVEGSRVLNMDIQRSADDPQPYVVFDRETITRSGAVNVGDFLKYRLTANATAASGTQNTSSFLGDTSNLNLRGLGTGQTLILIDGRRTSSLSNGGSPVQPDLNGIPLSSIERIEVLPTTASGIYGGGATGGVINVILRRDYSGVEVKLSHLNTFDSDTTTNGVDFAGGFNFEGGKTNLTFAGSYSHQNPLVNKDRDFVVRGRQAIQANNPGYYQTLTSQLPLGSTPNIRSVNGSNLVLKSGNTPLNSPITYIPDGYAGVSTDNGLALLANAGKYNLNLANSRQLAPAAAAGGDEASMMSAPTVKSLTATLRRQFTSRVQGFLEASASDNSTDTPMNVSLQLAAQLPVSAPNNPFTTPIYVQVPDTNGDGLVQLMTTSRRLVGGVIARLPGDWTGEMDLTWSRTKLDVWAPPYDAPAGSAAMAAGTTIDVMRDLRRYPSGLTVAGGYLYAYQQSTTTPFPTTTRNATLRFSGPIGSLPAGRPTLSTMVEYRDDLLGVGVNELYGGTSIFLYPDKSQTVSSVYLETLIPITRQIELQVAGRYDRYTTDGVTSAVNVTASAPIVRTSNESSSANPTVALRYQPLQDIALRASYGTGFLPPNVTQLVPNTLSTTTANQGTDPRRGNQSVVAFLNGGGNPNLKPEKSESFSLGAILTPRFVSGLRVSIDYTKIDKTDNIIALVAQQVIDNEAILPGRITRGANLPGDPAGYPGPITAIDNTLSNIAEASLEMFDLQATYAIDTQSAGRFDLFTNATWTTKYDTQIAPTTPVLDNVGYGATNLTAANPSKFRASIGLTWGIKEWTVGWNTSYFHSYHNYLPSDSTVTRGIKIANQGNGTGIVPSQAYHDVFTSYRFGDAGRAGSGFWATFLDQTELQVGVRNVFNKEPPFDAANTLYYYSYYGDPRMARYYFSLKKAF